MSHYTLLSGIDTTKRTFKCEGCGQRLSANLSRSVCTIHLFNVNVCSAECARLADRLHTQAICKAPYDPLILDTFKHANFDMSQWENFLTFLRTY